MAVIKPFRAIRPASGHEAEVAALPYDVMGSQEARQMVAGKPHSFLHVDKAEIDLDPSIDLYDDRVYQKARENWDALVKGGILAQDDAPCLYIYQLVMDGRAQTGLVCCASIDDYMNNVIKKHELTRADKEADRIRHVDTLDANTGPIFLTCRTQESLSVGMTDWMEAHSPVYDFVAEDGIAHRAWVIDDPNVVARMQKMVADGGDLYIADGHHRCASAVKVGQKRRQEHPGFTGQEEFNFFLSVIFPADQLEIMDYNRLVKDLNGLSKETFLRKLEEDFTLSQPQKEPVKPAQKHTFGMYLDGMWYTLTARPGIFDDSDPVAGLDVSILQQRLLTPILGIGDPRTDSRIDFVGGIRGLGELERRVSKDWAVAFSLYPTTLEDLMAIADAGMIMPPKSTWFEPKLRSGLFLHKLS